jgi:polycystin 1L2
MSNPEETVCICDDPPGYSFASSFFVAPNTIDFDTVFLKFDITNASVYGTLIGLFCLWLLAVLWTRRQDNKDKQQVRKTF